MNAFLLFFSALGLMICEGAKGESLEGSRPNIIFILTDDQGYGDIGAHGNPILKTPNWDRLYREGRRFTDFHVSPTCAPTRSALMTGRHEFKNGVTHTILERERLTPNAITIAQVLKQAGYATGIFGKWHLGDEEAYQPEQRGFDEVFIHGAGGIGQTFEGSCGDAPGNRYHNPAILHNGKFEKKVGYCTDLFFDQATKWMAEKKNESQPFFAWIATNAPHDPYVAKASDYVRYQSLAPSARVAHFYGMLSNIDDNIGRLLDRLREWKIEQETLVVFMNDNGGTAGVEVFNAGMRGQKVTPWIGGTRASSFWRWPGKILPGDCDALTAHVDVFRTLASLAGAKLSPKAEQQAEGRNLLPLLQDPKKPWEDRTLVTHVGRWPKGESPHLSKYRNCSIRSKQWHMVSIEGATTPKWQLFDVSRDYGEQKDVFLDQPEVAADLGNKFDAWWDDIQPALVNELAVGPAINPFKRRYWEQFGGGPAPQPTSKRPNILFCFADDWGRYASIYSEVDKKDTSSRVVRSGINEVVKTPNIDRVAKRGVLFRNAFVPAPSCTPCRSSLISGQYFWRTRQGSILQGAQWDSTLPSFPLLLKGSGYTIGKYQKVWSPGEPADAPFEQQKNAFEKAGRAFNDFSENLSKENIDGLAIQDSKTKILDELDTNFDSFLKERKEGSPFFFWFGPTLTHRQWTKGSGKKIWGIDPDSLQGKLPGFLPDVAEVREDIADYLGEVQALDAGIGILIQRLEAIGELDNTVIVLSGDHGMPGVPRGKCNLYDMGTAVSLMIAGPNIAEGRIAVDFVNTTDLAPTFLELARVNPPEVMQARSILPVLSPNAVPDSNGLFDSSRDFVITGRERHVAAARSGNVPYPQRALRTKDYLYVRNFAPDRWPMGDPKWDDTPPDASKVAKDTFACFADMDAGPTKAWLIEHWNDPQFANLRDLAFGKRPEEELYELSSDPDQMKNIVDDPKYSAILLRQRQRLEEELARNGDPRVLSSRPFFEEPPFSGTGVSK